ncbi:hypothetical protein QWY14_12760 [Planococcus sp. N028]|uniref:Uncharacterized protein n=1 Tax=Planococcus shixiaomingii TaxID=3058393 RepID=A0ABT8N4W0_9BACL|nr:hypothetical protein [Planococcus sp. N028]MDN7242677.1 hypothetical protein [Planococcus sp. N028]
MSFPLKEEVYYFTRVKDTHEQNSELYITLFARLMVKTAVKVKTIWVEIEEVKWEQASTKLQAMTNRMYTYSIPENVFHELLRVSEVCHKELYYLTPIYKTKKQVALG